MSELTSESAPEPLEPEPAMKKEALDEMKMKVNNIISQTENEIQTEKNGEINKSLQNGTPMECEESHVAPSLETPQDEEKPMDVDEVVKNGIEKSENAPISVSETKIQESSDNTEAPSKTVAETISVEEMPEKTVETPMEITDSCADVENKNDILDAKTTDAQLTDIPFVNTSSTDLPAKVSTIDTLAEMATSASADKSTRDVQSTDVPTTSNDIPSEDAPLKNVPPEGTPSTETLSTKTPSTETTSTETMSTETMSTETTSMETPSMEPPPPKTPPEAISVDAPPSDSITNCYCNKKRNFDLVELQCAGCYKWFHETCIIIPLGKCLPFMTYYTFFCKLCNPSGSETFSKKQPNFTQMCATALANLTHRAISESKSNSMFSKDKEVIPFLEAKWEFLTTMPRRVKQTWHSTVVKAMLKDNELFMCEEKAPDGASSANYPIFGLVNQDLSKIGPSYETMARSGLQKQIQDTTQTSGFSTGKGRSTKRRFVADGQISSGGKKVKSDLVMPKLPPNGYPLEHPFNKDGYRYILAEPDQHAPFRQEFDESQDWAGKPIPGWLYRKLTPNNVLLALHDRATQLKVSEDRLSVTGEKGYCMIRATHGVSWGTWYYEITIDDMVDGSATRLGWSQGLANLQAPLGYDKFSYSWRSRKGTKFHESRGLHFSEEGYGQGDTLGFLIHLPRTSKHTPLPPIYKDKPLVKFKSYLYYEEKDETQLELKRLKPLRGSKIVCYRNGKLIGTAFEDIHKGIYYPAASLYKSCSITFNFGPTFKHRPSQPFKSMHEAAHDAVIEQTMTDLLYFTENKGKLRLDNIF